MAHGSSAIVVPIIGDPSRLNKGLNLAQRNIQAFGVAAAAAMTLFAHKSLEAYAAQAKANFQLEFALKKNPALAKTSMAAWDEYNQTLSDNKAVTDEVLASAEAVGARFVHNQAELKRLTQVSIDYARVTGVDVATATEQLGKASLGSTRPLKALGVQFTASGHQGKDLTTVLQLVSDKVAGIGNEYMSSAAGQLDAFHVQMDKLQESIGAGLMPILVAVVHPLTDMLTTVNKLPAPVKDLAFALAAASAAAMAFGPRIMAAKVQIAQLETAAAAGGQPVTAFTRALGSSLTILPVVGAGLGIAATAFALFAQSEGQAKQEADGFVQSLDLTTGALSATNKAMAAKALADKDYLKLAPLLQVSQTTLINAWLGQSKAIDKVNAGIDDWYNSFVAPPVEIQKLAADLQANKEAFDRNRDATDAATGALGKNEAATKKDADAVDRATKKVQAMSQAWERFVGGAIDAAEAQYTYLQSTADLKKVLADDTKGQIARGQAIDTVLQNIEAVREAQIKETGQQRAGKHTELEQLKRLLQMAKAAGASADAIERIKDAIKGVNSTGGVHVSVGSPNYGGKYSNLPHAAGGYIRGPGSSTSDSIPAWLSNGEYVMRASAVSRYGRGMMDQINAGHFASGGSVSTSRIDNRIDRAAAPLLRHLDQVMQKAVDHLSHIRDAMSTMHSDLAQMAVSAGALGNITAPDGMHLSPQALRAGVAAEAASVRRFISKLKQLAKLGLSRSLMSQLIGMGPVDGMDYASALLQGGRSLIHDIDRMEGQMARLGSRTGAGLAHHYFGDQLHAAKGDVRRARQDLREARQAVRVVKQEVHVHLHASNGSIVVTEQRLARMVRDEIKQLDRHNGRYSTS